MVKGERVPMGAHRYHHGSLQERLESRIDGSGILWWCKKGPLILETFEFHTFMIFHDLSWLLCSDQYTIITYMIRIYTSIFLYIYIFIHNINAQMQAAYQNTSPWAKARVRGESVGTMAEAEKFALGLLGRRPSAVAIGW